MDNIEDRNKPYGKRLKNRFILRLVFSICEIVLLIPFLFGAVGVIFTSKSNTSYLDGRLNLFNRQRRIANLSLVLGMLFFVIIVGYFGYNLYGGANIHEDFDARNETTVAENNPISGAHKKSLDDTVLNGYYQFTLEGKKIKLPMKYKDFMGSIFDIEQDFKRSEYLLNPKDSRFISIYHNHYHLGEAIVQNQSKEAKNVDDCIVVGVRINNDVVLKKSEYTPNIKLYNGISFKSKINEITDMMGEPNERLSEGDNRDTLEMYQWRAPSYKNNYSDHIALTFQNDELLQVMIVYIGDESSKGK